MLIQLLASDRLVECQNQDIRFTLLPLQWYTFSVLLASGMKTSQLGTIGGLDIAKEVPIIMGIWSGTGEEWQLFPLCWTHGMYGLAVSSMWIISKISTMILAWYSAITDMEKAISFACSSQNAPGSMAGDQLNRDILGVVGPTVTSQFYDP